MGTIFIGTSGYYYKEFIFTIKAYKGLTHEISKDPGPEIAQYKQGVAPMMEAERLGAILFQFPYRFHYTIENREYLQKRCKEFEGFPLAIEFQSHPL